MHHLTPQDLRELRDSQLNVWASLGVYASVWTVLQIFLKVLDVDLPAAALFDRYGNFSFPGILIAGFLFLTALLPHWILLRQKRVGWFQAARIVRASRRQLVVEEPDEVRGDPAPGDAVARGDSSPGDPPGDAEYWQQRWLEVIKPLTDENRETRD